MTSPGSLIAGRFSRGNAIDHGPKTSQPPFLSMRHGAAEWLTANGHSFVRWCCTQVRRMATSELARRPSAYGR